MSVSPWRPSCVPRRVCSVVFGICFPILSRPSLSATYQIFSYNRIRISQVSSLSRSLIINSIGIRHFRSQAHHYHCHWKNKSSTRANFLLSSINSNFVGSIRSLTLHPSSTATSVIQESKTMSSQTKIGPLSLNDPNSFSNPDELKTEHLHFVWNVDFDKMVISGTATYDILRKNPLAKHIIFDIRNINIKSITSPGHDKLDFTIGDSVTTFGKPLTVNIPQGVTESKFKMTIEYETDPECSALQWLPKEQTSGKLFPYVFSQCQAIHARSLFPCQDTPSVKSTYTAEVTVPAELTVLMSAVGSGASSQTESLKCHKFEQKVPIPSYLTAIVVGKLEGKRIGPRTTVWAEAEFLEQGVYDFSETEDMIQAAEKLMGKYVWGVYDILILPSSFPFGGMENPCLTFVTPTLLTGDKSLANVIAHEIAHSWTGNLVTNNTFEDFWLNEGFTMFAERKIGGILKGEEYRQFQSIAGWKELKEVVRTLGETNPLTQLVPDLRGVDPDDAFSRIPYEKGYAFLYHLEEKVGGSAIFEPFLRDYIDMYKYKSLNSNEFKTTFINYFTKQGKENLIKDVDWKTWFFAPGMPPYIPKYDTTLAQACIDLKIKWQKWNPTTTPSPFLKTDFDKFKVKSEQIQEFLAELMDASEEEQLTLEHIKEMQNVYDFNSMKNAEIRFTWLRLCIKAKWLDQLPLALQFVSDQGRMKFIRPIYRDLHGWEETRSSAIDTFQKNRQFMMYVSSYTVAKDLQLTN